MLIKNYLTFWFLIFCSKKEIIENKTEYLTFILHFKVLLFILILRTFIPNNNEAFLHFISKFNFDF